MTGNTEKQERALRVLDDLLRQEKGRRRLNHAVTFLTSEVVEPSFAQSPAEWAKDWCSGWAFHVAPVFADALGVILAPRVRTETVRTGGKVQKVRHHYSVWAQTTNFAFREGYTLHQSAPSVWAEQLDGNGISLQIVEALPAAAGNAGMDRDSGFVVFQLFEKSDDGKKMQPVSKHTLTQDDFIRYLITGVMPQELDEDLTKR